MGFLSKYNWPQSIVKAKKLANQSFDIAIKRIEEAEDFNHKAPRVSGPGQSKISEADMQRSFSMEKEAKKQLADELRTIAKMIEENKIE